MRALDFFLTSYVMLVLFAGILCMADLLPLYGFAGFGIGLAALIALFWKIGETRKFIMSFNQSNWHCYSRGFEATISFNTHKKKQIKSVTAFRNFDGVYSEQYVKYNILPNNNVVLFVDTPFNGQVCIE